MTSSTCWTWNLSESLWKLTSRFWVSRSCLDCWCLMPNNVCLFQLLSCLHTSLSVLYYYKICVFVFVTGAVTVEMIIHRIIISRSPKLCASKTVKHSFLWGNDLTCSSYSHSSFSKKKKKELNWACFVWRDDKRKNSWWMNISVSIFLLEGAQMWSCNRMRLLSAVWSHWWEWWLPQFSIKGLTGS